MVPWSFNFHEEFVAAHLSSAHGSAPAPLSRWQLPPSFAVKINTDAAISSVGGIGLGIVIRNHAGVVLAAAAQRVRQPFSVQVAEATGILQGLLLAKFLGLLPASLESDSLSVVNDIHHASYLANLGLIIMDIQFILSFFPGSVVGFVPRLADQVAHCLAKFALSLEVDRLWLNDFPPCLCNLLFEDSIFCG
ncbi:hypothetical protein ACOSQ3_013339 [Xanthoceras sorbifolium]